MLVQQVGACLMAISMTQEKYLACARVPRLLYVLVLHIVWPVADSPAVARLSIRCVVWRRFAEMCSVDGIVLQIAAQGVPAAVVNA
jgi:hypothetical protein